MLFARVIKTQFELWAMGMQQHYFQIAYGLQAFIKPSVQHKICYDMIRRIVLWVYRKAEYVAKLLLPSFI